jgi:hypothetical protein
VCRCRAASFDADLDEDSGGFVFVHLLVDGGDERVLLRAQLEAGQLYALYNIAVRFSSVNESTGAAVVSLPCVVKAPTVVVMADANVNADGAVRVSGGRCADGGHFVAAFTTAITNPSVDCGAVPLNIADSTPAAGAWLRRRRACRGADPRCVTPCVTPCVTLCVTPCVTPRLPLCRVCRVDHRL